MAIFVTGLGVVSSIGHSVAETLDALCNRRSGIDPCTLLDTRLRHIPVCEIKYSDEELRKFLDIKTKDEFYIRTALLGIYAARQALERLNHHPRRNRIVLISATTTGGIGFQEQHYQELSSNAKTGRLYAEILDCAGIGQKIAHYFGIFDDVITLSTACSSSANAILLGARMIQNGICDKALVGGTDSLTKFTLNGFNSLEILSPTGCKPFDAHRDGVTLGEGAAWLLLESERTACPEQIICTVSGYANTNEAYHQTASSPDGAGAVLSMKQALLSAHLTPEQIDYINVHGTGTINNDLSEGRALDTVFKRDVPPFSSTKGYTGHTLGAAGALEAAISIMALQNNLLFPNVGFTAPMPEWPFSPIDTLREQEEIQHVLSNSFGFGGNNTSIIFSKQ